MKNRFLISVAAAALIAGTGFANAQGTNRESGGAAGGSSTVQQSAPSATQKAGETGGMKGAQTDQKAPGAAKSQQAEDGLKGQKSPQNTASDTAKGGKDMKAEGREGKTVGQAPQSKDSMSKDSAQTKDGMSKDSAQSKEGVSKDSTTTQSREGMSKDGTTNAQTKSGTERSQTTGNAATSATAAPPAEKRTQIVSAIKQERIQETTNVNFNISVGATVPATVRFHPVPARIVEIYPEWRGYEIILVHGRYIIVRPQTHEIVYIIEG
jgi:hypothetical protein